MSLAQYSKFSPLTVHVKKAIRQLRLDAGYSVSEGARLLGISRKQLEDIEAIRNYGCHIDLEIFAKIKVIYNVPLDKILGDFPQDNCSDFFERPRKRRKPAPRKLRKD